MRAVVGSTLSAPAAVVRMFFGSIFQREVRALGRRRQPYWVRCVYTLALAGVIGLVFFAFWEGGSGTGSAHQSQLQEIAPIILATVSVSQMIALALIAPVLTAGAIADEKRQRTLSSLLTTPLKSQDIILGKMGARTVQLLILALVPMPLLLALRVFGGVEAEAIVASMALGLGVGLLGACLALMFSIWHRRTPSSVFFALCTTVVLVFLPLLVKFIVQWRISIDEESIFLRLIAPIALNAVLQPDRFGGPSIVDVRPFWLLSLAYLLSTCVVVVLFSIFVMRRVLRREAAGTVDASVVTRLVAPGVQTNTAPKPGIERKPRTVGDRPVFWREMRQTATGSGTNTLIAFGIGIMILLAVYATVGLDNSGVTIVLVLIAAVGLTAQAALSTPAAISGERDAGSWGVLLTTPLPARQIVLGKVLGSVRRLWLTPAVLAFHLILVMIAGWFHPLGTLHALLLLGSLVFMLASTGVCFALLCKRNVTSAVLNMGLPLLLFLVIPLLTAFGIEYRFYNLYEDRSDVLSTTIMVSNPFLMLQEASTVATGEFDRFSFFLRYQILNNTGTIRALHFSGYVLLCSGAMLAIGGAALFVSIRWFNRWTGRAS